MLNILQKNCLVCGCLFEKRVNERLSDWMTRHKYCSIDCKNKAPRTEITKSRMRLARVGYVAWNKGKALSETHKQALRKKHKPLSESTKQKMMGRIPWNKIGDGITPIHERIRKSPEYKQWRKQVFERDNYTCQSCGKVGGDLHADHIKPFHSHPELRTQLSNGRTLCVPCHRETETYGKPRLTNAA